MRIQLDCIPCYISQALEASSFAELSETKRWETVKSVCHELSTIDHTEPSARVGQMVHKTVRDNANTKDPYREPKELGNEKALEFFDRFSREVESSNNPINSALKLAAAGNVIDFGPRREFDIEASLEDSLTEEFAIDHWVQLRQQLEETRRILYFADNSGEIIYDRLFIETLLRESRVEEIDLVVKDGPFLNDVTLKDAKELELNKIDGLSLRTVDNGDGGESPALWSREVESWMDDYDLTISKGQANYEGLSRYGKPNLFFLLAVKCPLIERDVGATIGSKVLINARRR